MVLICREPCLVNQAFKDSAWDIERWEPLISNRQFLPWLVREPQEDDLKKSRMITMGKINQLEEMWKKNPDATLKDLDNPEGLNEESDVRSV